MIDILAIADRVYGFPDTYNLYPWQQVAYCLRLHWNFVKYSDCK